MRSAIIATAVIIAGVGIVILINRDTGDDTATLEKIVDLVPEPLASDEIQGAGSELASDGVMPDLEAGGWIQIVDRDTGKLALQYRFARLDPRTVPP